LTIAAQLIIREFDTTIDAEVIMNAIFDWRLTRGGKSNNDFRLSAVVDRELWGCIEERSMVNGGGTR
jgi:hypothetical protein